MGSGWLKALEIRGATAFLAFLAFALASVGHAQNWLSLGAVPEVYAAGANLLAILFLVLSLPWILHGAGAPFRAAKQSKKLRLEVLQHLKTLQAEEALVFWRMVADGRRSTFSRLGYYDWEGIGHQGLQGRGLLVSQAAVGDGLSLWIPDHVWEIVQGDPVGAKTIADRLEAVRPEY